MTIFRGAGHERDDFPLRLEPAMTSHSVARVISILVLTLGAAACGSSGSSADGGANGGNGNMCGLPGRACCAANTCQSGGCCTGGMCTAAGSLCMGGGTAGTCMQ